jgi:hypothetical protein
LKTHIYAFGSVCRGDVSPSSDIDLLALVDGFDPRFDPNSYSVYSYKRINEIWREGNPFAWHLWLEAKLLYSGDGYDALKDLGPPGPYQNCIRDCKKFQSLFYDARASLQSSRTSDIFDLSTVFLGIRNLATCFAIGVLKKPDFSRHSALHLEEWSLRILRASWEVLEKSRILCTRGYGIKPNETEMSLAVGEFSQIENWMTRLVEEAERHAGRIQ